MGDDRFRYAALGIGGIIALLLLLLLLVLLLRDDDGGDAADTTKTTAASTTTTVEPTSTTGATSTTSVETTTTLPPPTTTTTIHDDPPDAITGVTVGTGGGSSEMMVAWSPSAAPDLASYLLYYSESSGGVYSNLADIPSGTTSYLDFPRPEAAVKPGNCYEVSAVDAAGNEGPKSAEACFQPSFFPEEAPGVDGGMSWGVYLATDDEPDYASESTIAIDRLTDLGYRWFLFGGELACDQGSAAALGKDPNTIAVAIYFETASDADFFATAYYYRFGDPVIGVAEVTTFCLD
ncbi:MAG: hypothetical protein BMS9Abin07_0706 [Acidimicrobiia bacterium]|nr:MAG: hypothetical protein BMS9Abin07_0706 [Acidimicrobiia bacterium]